MTGRTVSHPPEFGQALLGGWSVRGYSVAIMTSFFPET